ncbi:hypothetical protein CICLE_v10018305mg [Citrus x clementina]|uniref:U2A'/phosphoprotein 32 family A C-terminal domain-containing protein n=1 Tax=Citrus clementina TaxID=85681 RepID=V4U3U5_CITCL|nr:hypothetical protein CICLE_v10018305mg [Citrus x clementina]
MVRFSCFSTRTYSQRPKKTVQPSVEEMRKSLDDFAAIQAMKDSPNSLNAKTILLSTPGRTQINDDAKHVASSSSIEHVWKSDEITGIINSENDVGIRKLGRLKKSQSLGSRLCWEGKYPGENDTEEETEGFSSDSHDQNGQTTQNGRNDPVVSPPSEYEKAPHLMSAHINNESIFSIGDPLNSEKEDKNDAPISGHGDSADNYTGLMPYTPPLIIKSFSMPNIKGFMCPFEECFTLKHFAPRSRSSDDLQILGMWEKDTSVQNIDGQVMEEQERYAYMCKMEKTNLGIRADDCYDSCNYSALAKDWVMPDENSVKKLQGESLHEQWDKLPSKHFKIKRIKEWVNDLQHCSPLEESDETSVSNDQVKRDPKVLNGSTAVKGDGKVRITAGALPRGLHILNLSKNNISTIEGLRELTRLRVLDLSYNRILRIGHGLASCSSLKELYLAGNKISEVEGLHRLLKLTVLDLRFNKISTAKCLGQLAANYNSLQAISLEGNPAQKNVGDEQLKKNLQSLLPHLVYFNRQPMKASTLKDASDRSVRLGISAHLFDRGLRSDNKAARKSTHRSSLSTHGRKSQAAFSPPKKSRSRHAHLPPIGTKATTNNRHNYFDTGSRLLNLKSEFSMRRSRSEEMLGGGL